MDSDWYKASNALFKIIGYDTFENFVSDCVEIRTASYIDGGADSGSRNDGTLEEFQHTYENLVERR
jgi:hypothetical protein